MNHLKPQKQHVLPTFLWVSKKTAGDILLREHLFGDLMGKKKGPREGPFLTSVVAETQVDLVLVPLAGLGAGAWTAPSN